MKNKIILILTLILSVHLGTLAHAQTTTPNLAEDEIENFKEKIASKVAELTKQEQKAVTGFVVNTGSNQLSIKTDEQQELQVKIDDILTKIYQIVNNQKKEIKLSQIEKNDYLIIDGPSSDKSITANYIFVDEKYALNVGRITEIDTENFSLNIATSDKENIDLDIETDTKRLMLDIKTLELGSIGFSKIKEGDIIHFVVKKTQGDKEKTRFSAVKILIIPQEYFIK